VFQNRIRFSHISVLFLAAFVYCMVSITGCGSDSTPTVTTPADTNVVSFDSIDIYPGGANGIDLFSGLNVGPNSVKEDLAVIGTSTFYFQSGDMSGGQKTGLILVDSNTTKANYEGITTVSSWGTTIDPAIFSHTDTQAWGLLTSPLSISPVYGFYLQGKFASGGTGGYKVYGIMHVNSISSSGPVGVRVNVSVKINKAGKNKF